MEMGAGMEVMLPQTKECSGLQKMEEARRDLPVEASKGGGSCQDLETELLASRILRE